MAISIPVLIGGGSLAGIACAIRLKQLGHEALVLDKASFPRAKLCGEFLGPDALAALDALGLLALVQAHAFGPVEQTFFFNPKGKPLTIQHAWISRKHPYGLAIPRETLDALLLQQARQLGIPVLEGRRITSPVTVQHDQLEIKADVKLHGGCIQQESYATPCFIDATGRSGKLSMQHNIMKTPVKQRWVGIQCHIRLPENRLGKALRMFLFSGGYGGIQPISDFQANCCMMVEAGLAKWVHAEFDEFLRETMGRNPAAREILQKACRDGDFTTTADIHLTQAGTMAQAELIRIGDAQTNVDPFTGSGMAHALQTGLLAAEILHHGLERKLDYPSLCRQYQRTYRWRFGARLKLLQWFRPMLESDTVQQWLWPVLPPVVPMLAYALR